MLLHIQHKQINIIPLFVLLFTLNDFATSENLLCYQCERKSDTECNENELLPCPSTSDRCVTYITKEGGYKIKRECGLGPCTFEDSMVNKALGLGSCDISKNNYCLSCCLENGCNKNNSNSRKSPKIFILIFIAISVAILNIRENFQPPYLGKMHKYFL